MTIDLEVFDAEQRREKERIKTACSEAVAVFQKHFPTENGNLDAPIALAACVELFDISDSKNAGQLYLEWLVEHYVGRKVAANIDDVKKVVEALKNGEFTKDDPYVFNDMDNTLFYIPHETKLIFCSTSQDTRYIYMLEENILGPKFHVRRYYAEYDALDDDDWRREKEAEYHKNGILEAITNAFWLGEEWSDCLPGNIYPVRPSLQYFKDCGFAPQYGDCRDIGYVLSSTDHRNPRADAALFRYPEIKMAFFNLRIAVEEVE